MSPRPASLVVLLLGLGCSVGTSLVGGAPPDAIVPMDAAPDLLVPRDIVDATPPECRTDADCDDRVACTVDTCGAGRCQRTPSSALCSAGSACDALHGCRPVRPCSDDSGCRDDDPCTVAERCDLTHRVCVFDELPAETPCGASNSGRACRGGACQCPSDRASICAERCVDTRSDPAHCGGCAITCAAGSWCQDGACACPAPQVYCSSVGCVDTAVDRAHCGACGHGCQVGDAAVESCIEGMCLLPCAGGTHRCGTACAPDTSPATCGSSCTPCPTSLHSIAVCSMGRCTLDCAPGYHACRGACVEAASLQGCGPSCAVCVRPAHGSVACVADACRITCEAGYHACGGGCVSDLSPLSCGGSCAPCPVPPHGAATCAAGACGVTCEAGFRACGGTCSDGTSPLACGDACIRCPSPVRGTATCTSGACGFTCEAGSHRCDAACLANASPLSCGTACSPCPVPANGVATCSMGACGFTCAVGFRQAASGCVELLRLLAPGSLSTVTVRRPTLRWRLPPGLASVTVDLCGDRRCETVLETFSVTGSTATPTRDLPVGVVFWRVRGDGEAGNSTTWEFVVGASSAPVEASWGSFTDVNGDGYGDVVGASPDSRVFLFLGASTGLGETPAAMVSPPSPAPGFGQAIAAGDVNGDGYADVAVTAPMADGGAGRVFVFAGRPSGFGATLIAVLVSPAPVGGLFGASTAVAGDVDGDGYGDLLVGAPGAAGAGRVYLFRGGASGLEETPGAVLTGPDGAGSRFGASVAGAGDVDADGFADVIVGADGVGSDAGRVFVFHGSHSPLATTPRAELRSAEGGRFGASVAGIGDVDGDGYPDLAVGAPESEFVGRVLVFAGSALGIVATPARVIRSPGGMPGRFGAAVAAAGDFDGDGYADLVAGSPSLSGFLGGIHLFLGSATGVPVTPAATWMGSLGVGSLFGGSLASGRDIDGDGFSDLVVGAEYANFFSGAVLLVPGGALGRMLRVIPTPASAGGYFGHAVASAPPIPVGGSTCSTGRRGRPRGDG